MAEKYKSPQQYIFDEIYITSLNLGYETYDYLPPENTDYPFVFIGEQFDIDTANKTNVRGLVNQTVHVYHTRKKRRELTDMVNDLRAAFRTLKKAGPYQINVRSVEGRTIFDNSTSETLLHGIIEIEFRFN